MENDQLNNRKARMRAMLTVSLRQSSRLIKEISFDCSSPYCFYVMKLTTKLKGCKNVI